MNQIDVGKILDILPHRYPMLLVDRVSEYTPGKTLVAIKNVTHNEPFFQGHFPQKPIMPGVLILEAMAQAAGLLAFYSGKFILDGESVYYLVGIDKARFRQPVTPGDQLVLEVELKRERRGIFRFDTVAKVANRLVAQAEIMTTKAAA